MEKNGKCVRKNLRILEGEFDVLDSKMNRMFNDPFVRPGSIIDILFLREMKSRKCADLYNRISRNGEI